MNKQKVEEEKQKLWKCSCPRESAEFGLNFLTWSFELFSPSSDVHAEASRKNYTARWELEEQFSIMAQFRSCCRLCAQHWKLLSLPNNNRCQNHVLLKVYNCFVLIAAILVERANCIWLTVTVIDRNLALLFGHSCYHIWEARLACGSKSKRGILAPE